MSTLYEYKILLNNISTIAWQAGQKILEIYNESVNSFPVKFKEDTSPVTKADMVSHELILEKLTRLTPAISIISEEGEILERNFDEFWLVDPLDGTKEFIQRNDEFTVNIAYIKNGEPVLGVVCAPALNLIYGGIVGSGAFKGQSDKERMPIQVQFNKNDKEEVIIVGSRRHGDPAYMEKFLSKFENPQLIAVGSSLKFCKVAEGTAHTYPRFGRTMEWDTAAGQAVLMAAGGSVSNLNRETLLYGKHGFENPHFIAYASPNLLEKVINDN